MSLCIRDAEILVDARAAFRRGSVMIEGGTIAGVASRLMQSFTTISSGPAPVTAASARNSSLARTDARSDPAWLARILGWYARPATQAFAEAREFASLGACHDRYVFGLRRRRRDFSTSAGRARTGSRLPTG